MNAQEGRPLFALPGHRKQLLRAVPAAAKEAAGIGRPRGLYLPKAAFP